MCPIERSYGRTEDLWNLTSRTAQEKSLNDSVSTNGPRARVSTDDESREVRDRFGRR